MLHRARGNPNVSELSDVPADKQKIYEQTVWKRVHHDVRIKKTRWCVLRWPSPSMAQMAEMSTEAFEDFYFNVCTLDYRKMSRAMQPLKQYMERTDKVRLQGPRRHRPVVLHQGHPRHLLRRQGQHPRRRSLHRAGARQRQRRHPLQRPTIYRGTTHNDIRLVFKNGKIVEATSTATDKLNEVLDADAGARYVGEFAIGFNPYCTKPMKDILFDEKIAGSIHFTPGNCYDEASNGNKSDIHWDMVMLQTPEAGGGEIWFDDTLDPQGWNICGGRTGGAESGSLEVVPLQPGALTHARRFTAIEVSDPARVGDGSPPSPPGPAQRPRPPGKEGSGKRAGIA